MLTTQKMTMDELEICKLSLESKIKKIEMKMRTTQPPFQVVSEHFHENLQKQRNKLRVICSELRKRYGMIA